MGAKILFATATAFTILAGSAWAEPDAGELAEALRLEEIIAAMRVEGLAHAADLGVAMIEGGPRPSWEAEVGRIYDTDAMVDVVVHHLEQGMTSDDISAALEFFGSPLGTRIIGLEASARTAMTDPAIEEMAREAFVAAEARNDPRLVAIEAFVEANDLLERNLAGAMSSTYRFYVGLIDGGAYDLSEDEILQDVWSQEADIRSDTESWLFGFLMMAYRPLNIEDIEAYTAYSETKEGQTLNTALFAGFDAMYNAVSYGLGLSISKAMVGNDI